MKNKIKPAIYYIIIVALALSTVLSYYQYKKYSDAENQTYYSLTNRIMELGIKGPFYSIKLTKEDMNKNSMPLDAMKDRLRSIAADMYVAEHSSAVAANHWRITTKNKNEYDSFSQVSDFFGTVKTNIMDIVQTENDISAYTKVIDDLEGVFGYLHENMDEGVIEKGDFYEVKQHWKELMTGIHEQYSNSRIIKTYFQKHYEF
ncbi:hypothetical protein [Paenibacillus sp. Marseille-Q4541]|uniref:hypothetical protein n=1 Tax=Paenibacillus sp. Marseille-Q4541 TaxID=2831522 RepID=UPI001BA89CD6|nr:hypothetical protein [Paenibacillus sp. Marseille-Q4541]